MPGICGEVVFRGAAVYMRNTDGRWYLADADAVATMPVVGVSAERSAAAGQTWTFTYRLEGASTAVTTSISGAAQTTASDRAHGFTCAVLDRLAVLITATAGTPQVHLQWAIQFLPF